MSEQNPDKPIDYKDLRQYGTERLIEEHKIYRGFVENYPPRSFPDVLVDLIQSERKLRMNYLVEALK